MNLYENEVDVDVVSAISGQHKDVETLESLRNSSIKLLEAFANDDEIQFMSIASSNLGMVRTYQKRFRKGADRAPTN